MKTIVSFFENPFRLNTKSLALLRIALGIAFLSETLWQIPNIEAFFSDKGVYPLHLFPYLRPAKDFFSLHLGSGSLWWQYLLFMLQGGIGISLIVGFKTRFMAFFAWFMVLSMQNRTLHTLYGGDVLLRVSLFWAMFLPLGENMSFDAYIKEKKVLTWQKFRNYKQFWCDFCNSGTVQTVFTVATTAYVVQMAIYMFDTAFHKLEPSWITHFSALETALQSSIYRIPPVGDWLLTQKWALKPLTIIVLALELISPLLLLLPFKKHTKIWGIVGYLLVHMGIGMTMSVDLFPLFGWATILGLLPLAFWGISKKVPSLKLNMGQKFVQVVLIVPFLAIMTYNLADQGVKWNKSWYNPLKNMAYSIKIDQRWKMFAPPPSVEVWMTAEATLKNGTRVDLWRNFRGKPAHILRESHPLDNYNSFPTEKWHKYIVGLVNDNIQKNRQREQFARFLCRNWNGSLTADDVYEKRAKKLNIMYFRRPVWSKHPRANEEIVIIEDFSC